MGTTDGQNGNGIEATPGAARRALPLTLPPATVNPEQEDGERFSLLSRKKAQAAWPEMPKSNRSLLAGSVSLAALGLFFGTVPPMYSAGVQAIFPFTAEGKHQTCLTNLSQLQLALGQYAEDNDSHFPNLDYTDGAGKRVTWAVALQPMVKPDQLVCPAGPGIPSAQAGTLSSFAMNPVLAGQPLSGIDSLAKTVILADAGTKHDVSLLPPFPGWPSEASRAGGSAFDATETNIDFRHSGSADVLYADGHVDTQSPGNWLTATDPWGGSAAIRASLGRIGAGGSVSAAFVDDLKRTDLVAAAELLKKSPDALQPVTANLLRLWTYNTGDETSDSVSELGWNLARAAERAGDTSIRATLNSHLSRRNANELSRTNAAGSVPYTDQGEFTVNVPAYWTKSPGTEGNIVVCDIRSGLPTVFAEFESWTMNSAVSNVPLDWTGRENEIKAKFANTYKRVSMAPFKWNGHNAAVWELEVELPGGPRVHQLYAGYADGWKAHALAFSAPAKDFDSWRPFIQGLESSYVPQ